MSDWIQATTPYCPNWDKVAPCSTCYWVNLNGGCKIYIRLRDKKVYDREFP